MRGAIFSFVWLVFFGLQIQFSVQAEDRKWTRKDGNTVRATALLKSNENVTLRLENGERFEMQIKDLSIEDQAYLKEWTQPKRPIKVPENAVYFRGSWYAVILETVTRHNANEKAVRAGGHLAWIKDEDTQKMITKLADGLRLWIDGSDEEVEGQWRWSDGSKFTYKMWSKGQPDNARKREHHIHLYRDGKWNDMADRKIDPGVVGYIVQWDM